ncbi:glyoxylase-like metal-dependent hydrolase (beta-lactamase superfamily II) [Jatrophihabitans sp. GAS493]|uniref:MBL fold metallo-hydrolase n=1 Tax=Jatrophihabitans sp. GAS493 TaxID=1907575 RepID=UPI000BB7CDF9|nr:MBL fold metallo-hydrolase [Jatrophihabitans sp. GAS493]SOD74259.1 glyoxylase-like metal-dependent hydrolase (beta-lactamase superfamily II) [Jatrophihabitans sp. GAS493]
MLIAGFPSAYTGTNCYVLAPAAGEQCVIVDPGIEVVKQLDEVIAEHRLHPAAVILTHGHFDHSFSVFPVCQARDVAAYIHPSDRDQLKDPWTGVGMRPGTPLFGQISFAEPDDVRELTDGATLQLAGLSLGVRHAPGHTSGSVIFTLDDDVSEGELLLSGDVLFQGSIGRVDLPGGSMEAMTASLRDVILPMDDAVTVYPGHGPSTTIGRERISNPYLMELQ